MKVTLNKNQLDHLSRLIEMKGVNFYDVNQEMTDHVASEVEEEIESSGLEYMKAVKKVFLRYDRFHFMNIEEEKTKKIQKQSWKQAWKSFLQFFTPPKIILTIGLFLLFQLLIENGFVDYLAYSFIFLVLTISGGLFYLKRKWIGKKNYLQLHKFHGWFSLLLQLTFQGMLHIPNNEVIINPMFHTFFTTFSFLLLLVMIEIYTNELKLLKLQFA